MSSVHLRNISKRFGKTEVIQDISLDIETNALTVFVGPSGCGKSTLLRMIAGLEKPSSGEIFIDEEQVNDTPPFKRGVAMVFQSYALYPHMSVYQNMRFGLTSLSLSEEEIKKRIEHAGKMLGLTELFKRKPKQLSGGQRQRVAMGRAIVRQPKVFLFDEPLSNLDAALRTKMRLEIAKLRRELNATAVYVTHDQIEAMTLADKIVVLKAGRIEQEGSPLEVYHHPANKFVAGFLGSPSMNFVRLENVELHPDSASLRLPGGSSLTVDLKGRSLDSNEMEVGIRPEHLSLDPKLTHRVTGKVIAVERLGDQNLVHLTLGKDSQSNFVARLDGDEELPSSGDISLGFEPRHSHLFESNGHCFPAALQ